MPKYVIVMISQPFWLLVFMSKKLGRLLASEFSLSAISLDWEDNHEERREISTNNNLGWSGTG